MKEDVCEVCNGNDYVYQDGIVEQCPLCIYLGKLYEPEEVEMKPELKPFQHIIDILFNRDGWIKLPLFDRQEVKINGKTKYTRCYY